MKRLHTLLVAGGLCSVLAMGSSFAAAPPKAKPTGQAAPAAAAEASRRADASEQSQPPMLVLGGKPANPETLDYAALPVVKGEHAVVSAPDEAWQFRLHNYLIHHDGKYWCMWSHGPVVEDRPTQHVRYAVSDDGLKWSESRQIVGPPDDGYGYIARGFWLRDGEFLALAAHYKGHGAFGVDKDLSLEAFVWDAASGAWKPRGRVFDNAINNFAPEKLSSGPWMTTRRDARFNNTMLVGGVSALNAWEVYPVSAYRNPVTKFAPDEPIWWEHPDGRIVAAFRDNGGSSRLFRAFSTDQGRSWTTPLPTNFPNATSKLYSFVISGGVRLLINNANPKPGFGRRQLHVAFADNGLTFTRLARLDIPFTKPATFQYPHAIEHDGHVLIAFSRNKTTIEVLKIPTAALKAVR